MSKDIFRLLSYTLKRMDFFPLSNQRQKIYLNLRRFYFWSDMPAPGAFLIPHSLALDSKTRTLYVADRENGRVQVFNSVSGAFVDEIKLPEFGGLVYAVAYSDSERE